MDCVRVLIQSFVCMIKMFQSGQFFQCIYFFVTLDNIFCTSELYSRSLSSFLSRSSFFLISFSSTKTSSDCRTFSLFWSDVWLLSRSVMRGVPRDCSLSFLGGASGEGVSSYIGKCGKISKCVQVTPHPSNITTVIHNLTGWLGNILVDVNEKSQNLKYMYL